MSQQVKFKKIKMSRLRDIVENGKKKEVVTYRFSCRDIKEPENRTLYPESGE